MPKRRIIAHRGQSVGMPEQTMLAFGRIRFDLAREGVLGIAVARGRQIARGIRLLTVERCSINVPWQEQNVVGTFSLGDDMDLMSAFPAETGRGEAMAWRAGGFELTFEQDISGRLGQRGENLTCAGDELVEFERQECACPRATPFRFREAYAGQECLKRTSARIDVYAAIL